MRLSHCSTVTCTLTIPNVHCWGVSVSRQLANSPLCTIILTFGLTLDACGSNAAPPHEIVVNGTSTVLARRCLLARAEAYERLTQGNEGPQGLLGAAIKLARRPVSVDRKAPASRTIGADALEFKDCKTRSIRDRHRNGRRAVAALHDSRTGRSRISQPLSSRSERRRPHTEGRVLHPRDQTQV